jgi:hypothetical protein
MQAAQSVNEKREILRDWYQWMNLDRFKKVHEVKTTFDVDDQLLSHDKWCMESNIQFTPTLFINQYALPKQYNVKDLKGIVNGLESFFP